MGCPRSGPIPHRADATRRRRPSARRNRHRLRKGALLQRLAARGRGFPLSSVAFGFRSRPIYVGGYERRGFAGSVRLDMCVIQLERIARTLSLTCYTPPVWSLAVPPRSRRSCARWQPSSRLASPAAERGAATTVTVRHFSVQDYGLLDSKCRASRG
jgi:hypothetical protein